MWSIRTGLLRAYVSRVENGHTVPAVETLEKFARALEVPVYQLFYEGNEAPKPALKPRATRAAWGDTGREARELERFRRLLSRMEDRRRGLLLSLAQRLAARGKGTRPFGAA
jgi:transcriptional regulator with XRE-family HTH domain